MEKKEKEPELKELIQKLVEQQDKLIEAKEIKEVKPKWSEKLSLGKMKKGWVQVLYIRNNGSVTFLKAPTKDGAIMIDGFPRIATIDYTLRYGKFPLLIVPEWSIKPFSPADNYEQSVKEEMNLAGRNLILAALQSEKITAKKSFGGMGWIILGIAGVALIWYLMKGGNLF